MDDVWFGPGLNAHDYEGFLQALSLQAKDRPPLIAVARMEETGARPVIKLVMASRSLFRLFGVDSAEDASARLLEGPDPGSKRLLLLSDTLPLNGAPRLERLRFSVGPGSEIITFLCRRIDYQAPGPVFLAAALGVRPGLIPDAPEEVAPPAPVAPTRYGAEVAPVSPAPHVEPVAPVAVTSLGSTGQAVEVEPVPATPSKAPIAPVAPPPSQPVLPQTMNVQAIQAALHSRWPAQRTVRFLWQTDANTTLTSVTPALTDVVGAENGDVTGRSFADLASSLDATGRLTEALASRKTWSGLDVLWPISGASAAVKVALGALPSFDRDGEFDGYRGFGVIHTDQIAPQDAIRLARQERAAEAPRAAPHNVVPFPGHKTLSPEDQEAFDALGTELRDQAGLNDPPPEPEPTLVTEPEAPAEVPTVDADAAPLQAADAPPAVAPKSTARDDEAARNGLAILDRLAVGILVSRTNIPIFANRHLLDLLGFADEDALHAAGGMAHLFGGVPGNVSGSEAVGIRTSDGTIVPTQVRMQRVDWDGLPATLLTLQSAPPRPAPLGVADLASPAADALSDASPSASDFADPAAGDELHELRAILETATDGVAVMDSACNVLSLNRSGEALFDCHRVTVIGKPFLSLFAPDNQNLAAEYLEGLKSNAEKSLLNDGREFVIKTHHGGLIPVFMTLGRLGPAQWDPTDSTDEGPRFCALFRDLTHWKKVERDLESAREAAERASALKSDFLTKVNHEIRTPLNAIIGFAETMTQERYGPLGNPRYREYARDIQGSGTHVLSLVNDLLDLSRIEAGRMELSIADLDANKLMGECVAMMQPEASRARIILRLSLGQNLPPLRADERAFRQIVLNILSNAIKFNEPGGQVIIATAAGEGPQVVVRVRDTGPGMSDADIAAALTPFVRVPSQPDRGGTGLGLPLTKALAEANHAAFAIRSKPNHGTLVEIAFPASAVLAG